MLRDWHCAKIAQCWSTDVLQVQYWCRRHRRSGTVFVTVGQRPATQRKIKINKSSELIHIALQFIQFIRPPNAKQIFRAAPSQTRTTVAINDDSLSANCSDIDHSSNAAAFAHRCHLRQHRQGTCPMFDPNAEWPLLVLCKRCDRARYWQDIGLARISISLLPQSLSFRLCLSLHPMASIHLIHASVGGPARLSFAGPTVEKCQF